MTYIERSLPLGDRDEEPSPLPLLPGSPDSSPVVERKPDAPLAPGIDLQLPEIERAIDDGAMALRDLKSARARRDWPMFEAAAKRLAEAFARDPRALSRHVARAVSAARERERQLSKGSEGS